MTWLDADRRRLLAHGRMAQPTYSSRPLADVSATVYRVMQASADALRLHLTEPVVREGDWDGYGGRIVTVEAGCYGDPDEERKRRA